MSDRHRERMITRLYQVMPGSEFPKGWEGEPMDHPNWDFCEAITDTILREITILKEINSLKKHINAMKERRK